MIRYMHLLAALTPQQGRPIVFAAKEAEFLPVQGIRLYFCAGQRTRIEHIGHWLMHLNRNPLGWVQPSTELWTVDVDGAKQRLEEELAKSPPYRAEFSWPHWLNGKIILDPHFERADRGEGSSRLAFYITELAVAKAKNPAIMDARVSHYNYFGEVHMSGDVYQGISNSTIVVRSKVEGAFNRLQDSGQSESAKLLVEIGKRVSDANNPSAGAVYNQMADEISKSTHDKGIIKSYWDGLVAIMPPLTSLSAEVIKAFAI